jgi:hypothetical protein
MKPRPPIPDDPTDTLDVPRPGRPSKQTADLVERLKDAIGLGMPLNRAARAVGIGRTTLFRWLEAPDFRDDLKGAQAAGELALLGRVRDGAPGWQGSAWLLERRYERWRKKDETTVRRPLDGMGERQLIARAGMLVKRLEAMDAADAARVAANAPKELTP